MNAGESIASIGLAKYRAESLDAACKVIKAIKPIASIDERKALLASFAAVHKPFVVSFVNAHALNLAWNDPEFAKNLYRSDVLLKDGIGVSLLTRGLGINSGINMNGTDFIPEIAVAVKGKRIAVLGTQEPYLTLAANKIRELGGNVVLTVDGFQPHASYFNVVRDAAPEVVILGMGMPKQEAVSMLLADALETPTLIVNGGAILDFWANRFPRAPLAWQKLRLEWLFRMLQEPGRLWKRYTLGGFAFVSRYFRMKFSGQF